ncbi:MAG: ornithine carbamoyltransferase [Hyphomicrobiaceae bacterium TMED74]|nr:ornithine carbamoyltransferase [Filomicrobium sp.]RPG34822.1 MAG: ornithine carbamoyltransferase [Hyphomicrobiaceae bacterium TMED74]
MALRHFLDINSLSPAVLRNIVDAAHEMKRAGKKVPARLSPEGIDLSVLVMIFEKPSTRTRVSYDVAMRQLGGQTIVLNHSDLQLGRGESVSDTAKVLSRYADAVMLRANSHTTLVELAENSTVPVINGLTDKSHPCQIIADIMTFEESHGPIRGQKVAWVGDGNNVAVSWIHAASAFDFELSIACPGQMRPDKEAIDWLKNANARVEITDDPQTAVRDAKCVVTDTWVSMGDTDEGYRKQVLGPYAVEQSLMSAASDGAVFMHCLPAYRGHEVSAEVIDGPQSVVFDEAENRLHAQKAILSWCLGGIA